MLCSLWKRSVVAFSQCSSLLIVQQITPIKAGNSDNIRFHILLLAVIARLSYRGCRILNWIVSLKDKLQIRQKLGAKVSIAAYREALALLRRFLHLFRSEGNL